MARLVADETRKGCVLAMDLQKDALESTSSLLDRSLTADEVLFSCSSSDHIPTTDFAINYIDHFCILIILGMFCSNCNSFKKLQPFPPHNAYIYVRKTCSWNFLCLSMSIEVSWCKKVIAHWPLNHPGTCFCFDKLYMCVLCSVLPTYACSFTKELLFFFSWYVLVSIYWKRVEASLIILYETLAIS